MRKLLISTLVAAGIVAGPALVVAQARRTATSGAMMIGPWAGVNFATFGGASATNTSTRTGVALGAQLQRELAPNVFLRIGAFYSMRGASDPTPETIKANLIEFPVQVGYSFSMQGSEVKPYVVAGAQLGVKASCTVESGGSSSDCNTALGSSVASTDFGVAGGAGVAFPAGKAKLMVEGRYYAGFTNLVPNAGGGAELKNKGFSIIAGYMVRTGR